MSLVIIRTRLCGDGVGKGQTGEFKDLSADAQPQLCNGVQKKRGAEEVVALVNDTFEAYEDNRGVYANRGVFHPEAWWVRLGYDGERIAREAKPADIRESRMHGVCYRVPVESSGNGTVLGITRRHHAAVPAKKRKVGSVDDLMTVMAGTLVVRPKPAPQHAQAPLPEHSGDSDDSSTPSSSASSTSSSSASNTSNKPNKEKNKRRRPSRRRTMITLRRILT